MTSDAPAFTVLPGWVRPLRWSVPTVSTTPLSAAGGAPKGDFVLPLGTVTFLLTDVEGSTLAWQAAPAVMGTAIARHYEILDAAVARYGGVRPQEQGEGDSIVAAFGRASDALMAAVDAQRTLGEERWPEGVAGPLRVRMAIHTGEAQTRNEANYVGQAIIRTARLRAIAYGGQVLLSQAVRDLVIDQLGDRLELIDLGLHRLKDLARPEHVWQVAADGLGRDFPSLKSLDAMPNNLPMELSSFVGRQNEITAVCALVHGNRLVTVTGAGGAGKTRLAQQVGGQVSDRYPDGTWWVELAAVDASAVRSTIADVVSINEPDRLVERLGGRMLLVLDNCEHVLDAVAPLVHQILVRCPDVSILATSRGPLDVPGEVTWRLPPLAVPQTDVPVSVETLAQYDAVRLFVDRAQRARPNFALTGQNGPAIAELCSRLDGIPLAIELAAARAKSLTAEQILNGLDDSLRLLTGGSRLMMPRQQTLEASIRWSHDLLGDTERILLRRLSVFAGGWDLEAAEAICADPDDSSRGASTLQAALMLMDVLDCLEHLIDQSLVRVDERNGKARYELLETVRQFAAVQLSGAGTETVEIADRHANWYLHVAAETGPLGEGPLQEACVARLAPDRDNLGAALRRWQATGNETSLAEMVLDLGPFWNAHGSPADGRTWTTIALDLLAQHRPDLRARLHMARATHRYTIGHRWLANEDCEAAAELAATVGDRRTLARARTYQAGPASYLDLDAALLKFDAAAVDSEAVGDTYGEVWNRIQRTTMLFAMARLRSAGAALDNAESRVRELNDPGFHYEWNALRAWVCLNTADHAGLRASLQARGVSALRPWDHLHFSMLLAADHGENDLPEPEPFETWIRNLERAENFLAALTLKFGLFRVHQLRGETEQARSVADTAFSGDLPYPRLCIAGALLSLALGDDEGARQRLEMVDDMPNYRLNPFVELDAQTVVAVLERRRGDLVAAETAAHRALALCAEHGPLRELMLVLEVLAGLAAAHGSWAHAARLAGAAQQKRDTHPLRFRQEPVTSMLSSDLAAARDALGDDAYASAFDEGRQLSIDDAVAYAQRMRGERSRPTIGWMSLTPTERRVVDLARQGRSNTEIAKELLMGTETVKTHLSRSYAKLDVANRTQLAALTPPAPAP